MSEDSIRKLLDKIKSNIENEGLSAEYWQLMRAMRFIKRIVEKGD